MKDSAVQSLSERKRCAIVAAAVVEFTERGFEAARMDAVAAKAQVSKRTLYRHFPSKLALFREIVEGMIAALNEANGPDYDPGRPLAPQLAALGWREGRLFCDPCRMASVRMILAEARRDQALAAELDARLDHAAAFRRFFAAAAEAGALDAPDSDVAAAQFLALLKAQAFWPAMQSGRTPTEREVERVIDAAVRLVAAAYGRRPDALNA
jgi:TetR/AcrR family transcriptional regulator of autoinduction and epiphytic fitness